MPAASKPRSNFSIVCDVETSGSCPIKNGVIAACILIIDNNLNVVEQFVRYVRPPDLTRKWWSSEAQGIHGIPYEKVETFMPNDQFCYELLCLLGKYKSDFPLDFICHASPKGWFNPKTKQKGVGWFDYFFLEWCFRKARFQDGKEMVWTMYKVIRQDYLISTIQMGRDLGYKKNDLKTWAERVGFNLNHHDATSDTYCALEVYKKLRMENAIENSFGHKLQVSI